jgi:tetratricopeptide (TPR) repeat protein
MYDQSVIFSLSAYAENEYAQLMEEAGTIGVALCLVFVLIIAASYFKSIWKPRRPIHFAAYGLGFGLLAILIQSGSDFGQHDAANACLTATFAALLIVLARHARPLREKQSSRGRPRAWFARPLRIAGALAVVCIFIFPLRGADATRRARVAWAQTAPARETLDAKGWDKGSNAEYASLLLPAAEAARIEPQDVFIGYWLNQFRWVSLQRYRDPKTGALTSDAKWTSQIVDELNKLRPLCPTFAAPYSLAGKLEYFELGRAQGAADIRTGYRLDHNDPDSCLAAAELDAVQKRWAESTVEARRALRLDPVGSLNTVLDIYLRYGRPDIAYELTKRDLGGLGRLAELLHDDPKYPELAARSRKEATALLLETAQSPDASADVLAAVAQFYDQQGRQEEAINYYERALVKNYGQVDWRLRLAQLLAKSGNPVGAEKEARACLRLRPNMTAAITLLAELSVRNSDGK